MSKHTPGPWELQKPLFGEQHIYVHSENSINGKVLSGRQHICVVPYEGKRGSAAYHEMFNANARLIAAAPELLAALRIAREHIQIDRNSFKEAHSFPDGFMEREDQSTLKQLDQKLAVIDAAIANAEGGEV